MALNMSEIRFAAMVLPSKFYRPASAAYGGREGLHVSCDRCGMQNITACFHEGTQDLCLWCAAEVTKPPAAPVPPRAAVSPISFINGQPLQFMQHRAEDLWVYAAETYAAETMGPVPYMSPPHTDGDAVLSIR